MQEISWEDSFMIEFLFLVLGVAVGYNIRHERKVHQENLVYEKVDARVRHELSVATQLNQSLLTDVAELKRALAAARAAQSA
jgi:hypothetical protein